MLYHFFAMYFISLIVLFLMILIFKQIINCQEYLRQSKLYNKNLFIKKLKYNRKLQLFVKLTTKN